MVSLRHGSGRRATIYDAKGDEMSKLAGLKAGCPVKTLHPLDAGGAGWDIAADFTTVAVALAALLIPDEDEGPNGYFTKTARHILAGVLRELPESATKRLLCPAASTTT